MNRRVHRPISRSRGRLALPEAGGNRLQGVARGNLRLMPACHERPARDCPRAYDGAFRFQRRQARVVDWVERQGELEPLLGRRVELAGRFQRFLAFQVLAVALEAQRLSDRPVRAIQRATRTQPAGPGLTKLRATGGAQPLRSFAFQLPALKRNPFAVSRLQ
jgi:hypothetical protein